MLLEQRKIELSGAIAAKRTIRTRLAQVDPVMSEIEQNIVTTKSETCHFCALVTLINIAKLKRP